MPLHRGHGPARPGRPVAAELHVQRRFWFCHRSAKGRREKPRAVGPRSGQAHRQRHRAHHLHAGAQVQHGEQAARMPQRLGGPGGSGGRRPSQPWRRNARAHEKGPAARSVCRVHRNAVAQAGEDRQQVRLHRARLHDATRGGRRNRGTAAVRGACARTDDQRSSGESLVRQDHRQPERGAAQRPEEEVREKGRGLRCGKSHRTDRVGHRHAFQREHQEARTRRGPATQRTGGDR
ncbi:hypothetical protein D3C71_1427980 [compost metagenome]